jgi:hypothetical protein
MTTTYYHKETVIRTTKSGATCYHYHYFESFGRETGYARSWGNREKRGTGMIWAKPGESFDDAIARRRAEYSDY